MAEHKIIQDPDLVVAIDVGSTHSGYAWQWRGAFKAKGSVEFNTNWGEGTPEIHKTSTSLLLKYNTDRKALPSIEAFGDSAENKFADIKSEERYEKERHRYHLFKMFKMYLYDLNTKDSIMGSKVESVDGLQEDFLTIMYLFIKSLKDDFLQKHNTIVTERFINKTLWILTVPALWSEKTKMFMRKAAETAGIGEKHLLLASEPECAAVYCLNLPQEQQLSMGNLGKPGAKFLTVDIGGGTGDLSAVEVQSDGTLKELCNVSGERVGGQQVNEAFFQAMYNSFKDGKATQIFAEATMNEINQLQENFEKGKLRINTKDEIVIKLFTPIIVRKKIESGELQFISDAPISYNIKSEKLEVKCRFVHETLFKTPCELINSTILKVLNVQTDIKIVVLVGGFAESGIVQENVRSEIKEKYPEVKVVVPTSPFRAVLTGAVLFGHNPLIFKSRISRATYGIEASQVFDESKHDQSKKWLDKENNVNRCSDVFFVHVRKGEHVSLNGEIEAQTYSPIYKSQKALVLNIYESSEVGPTKGTVMYTTDIGCKKLATINIDVPTAEESSKRSVSVRMIYGGTQLSVIAKCAHTGKECREQIRFD